MFDMQDATHEEIAAQLARYERILKSAANLTAEEKASLAAWEKCHAGDGKFATSEWPGWDAAIRRDANAKRIVTGNAALYALREFARALKDAGKLYGADEIERMLPQVHSWATCI